MDSDTFNPINYIADNIICVLTNNIIPIPLINTFFARFVQNHKLTLFVTLISLIGFFFYFISGSGNIFASTTSVPSVLNGYIEHGFVSSNLPKGSPIGGVGMQFTSITAYYHDLNYFFTFGRWHDGIDIIPNDLYYKQNKAYLLTKQIIIIATISGNACSFVDVDGGLSITITSFNNQNRTLYHHQSVNFIPFNTCRAITSGSPVGVMGASGNATGTHVHYGTFRKDTSGSWIVYDPLPTLTLVK